MTGKRRRKEKRVLMCSVRGVHARTKHNPRQLQAKEKPGTPGHEDMGGKAFGVAYFSTMLRKPPQNMRLPSNGSRLWSSCLNRSSFMTLALMASR